MYEGKAALDSAAVVLICLAFAVAIWAAVICFGYISGAHINPAVTLSLAERGIIPWKVVPVYFAGQFVGAIIAGLHMAYLMVDPTINAATFGNMGRPNAVGWPSGYDLTTATILCFLGELVGTLALLLCVYFGAVDPKAPPGWAASTIGMWVAGIIWAELPLSGTNINPARWFASAICATATAVSFPWALPAKYGGNVAAYLADAWWPLPVFWIAEFIGALIGGWIYWALRTPPEEA